MLVDGPPDDVLLRCARALRRLGTRITRYDGDAGTLEARGRRWPVAALVRLAVREDGPGRTRVRIESAAAGARLLGRGAEIWTIRRFRAELTRAGRPRDPGGGGAARGGRRRGATRTSGD